MPTVLPVLISCCQAPAAAPMEAPLPEDPEALRPFELKAELKRRGLTQTGSKAEMVERMRQAYDTDDPQGPPDEAEGGPPEADGEL